MEIERLCPRCMGEMPEGNKKICPHCGYDFDSPREITHQLKPFTILEGKYLVGDVLGEGGFGITYIGFDLNLEIKVAIKEFYPNGFATRESQYTSELTAYAGQNMDAVYKWRDNFVKEARSLAKCSHLPGIVGVKDYFQENNTAYIIMEYLEGQTLKEHMKARGGKLPAEDVFGMMRPVISSLEEVHKEGLIHRDISPDNLILLKGGNVKLLDFGAARDYTDSGEKSLSVMLKPGYAPEEQYRTKGKQGPWSDVYALCATMYKCITGITPPESMERMRQDELKKISSLGISISPQGEAALEKGMAVFAEERCQSMGELENLLYGSGMAASVSTVSQSAVPAEKPAIPAPLPGGVPAENAAAPDNLQKIKEQIRNNKNAILAAVGVIAVLLLIISVSSNKGAKETKDASAVAQETGNIPTEENIQPTETIPAAGESQEETVPETPEASVEHAYRYVVKDCSWTEAYMECKESGGHLVTFDSLEEYEEILTAIENQGLGDYRFFIGGMRNGDSYDYHWIEEGGDSDTVLNTAWQEYWMAGEPSYADGEMTENYMMIFWYEDEDDWVWNDVPNDVLTTAPYYAGKMGYICEYEDASLASLEETAPEPQIDMSEKAREIEAWRAESHDGAEVFFGEEAEVGASLYDGIIDNDGTLFYGGRSMSANSTTYAYMDNQLCYSSGNDIYGNIERYYFNGELIKVVFSSYYEEESPSYVLEYGDLTDEDRQSAQWDLQEREKIRRIFSPEEYILPDADSRYVSREELESMDSEELRYIRNEIYARHGYIFQDEILQAYFMGKNWYSPTVTEVPDSALNEYELANRDLVVEMEQ